MQARVALILCATPRSGSGLLGSALWETGLAGRPDEFFARGTRAEYAERWGARSDRDYVSAMLDFGTRANGVFGAKVHWPHLESAAETLRAWHGAPLPPDPLSVLAPRTEYVWMRRRDTVRQAVSAVRARRSGVSSWREGPRPEWDDVPFDYTEIESFVSLFREWDAAWQTHFASLGIAPLEVVYEDDLERGVDATARRILGLLGVEVPAGLAITSPYRKQSDEVSEALVRRYAEEAAARC